MGPLDEFEDVTPWWVERFEEDQERLALRHKALLEAELAEKVLNRTDYPPFEMTNAELTAELVKVFKRLPRLESDGRA